MCSETPAHASIPMWQSMLKGPYNGFTSFERNGVARKPVGTVGVSGKPIGPLKTAFRFSLNFPIEPFVGLLLLGYVVAIAMFHSVWLNFHQMMQLILYKLAT